MSYKVEVRANARAYPVIVCDHCGELITDASDAHAIWLERGSATHLPKRHDVVHVHDRCDEPFTRAHPPGKEGEWYGHWMWNELDHNLFMLLLNSGYDAKAGKRAAVIDASIN
jgi:hypothetical protein